MERLALFQADHPLSPTEQSKAQMIVDQLLLDGYLVAAWRCAGSLSGVVLWDKLLALKRERLSAWLHEVTENPDNLYYRTREPLRTMDYKWQEWVITDESVTRSR